MADGRYVTDYRPSCEVHDLLIKQNGIMNSYDYRQFMINNAGTFMQIDRDFYNARNQCNSCKFYHVDPNGNDSYWDAYTTSFGYSRK